MEQVESADGGESLANLSVELLAQYTRTGSLQELDDAVEAAINAVRMTPDNQPKLGIRLETLHDILKASFCKVGIADDLGCSILATRRMLEVAQGQIGRSICLCKLSSFLNMRYQQTQSPEDLKEAVITANEAYLLSDEKSPRRILYLQTFFLALHESFLRTGAMEDLERAIEIAEIAVELTSEGSTSTRADSLTHLCSVLKLRYEQISSLQDLDRAIAVGTEAVECSQTYDRSWRMATLGGALLTRFRRIGAVEDLNRAITMTKEAVEITPLDSIYRVERLQTFSYALQCRFERMSLPEDLEGAISSAYESIKCAENHRNQTTLAYLHNSLSNALNLRFKWEGSMEDLNRAVDASEDAVKLIPGEHSIRPVFLNNLCIVLSCRYDHRGSLDDLNRAIDVAEELVTQTPKWHAGRWSRLNNLGGYLKRRFERLGSIKDLEAAIVALEESVDLIPQDDENRSICQNTFGSLLIDRYERIGSFDDLHRAVNILEDVISLSPPEHLDRAVSVINFAIAMRHSGSLGFVEYFDRAIEQIDQVLGHIPSTNPSYGSLLNSRGITLMEQFERTKRKEDLAASLVDMQKAIDFTSPDNPNLSRYVYHLSRGLERRFEETGLLEDLEAAIIAIERALKLIPLDHHNRAIYLEALGDAFETRAKQTMSTCDTTRAVIAYEKGVYESSSPPVTRIRAATKAVEILGFSDLSRSCDILRVAVRLLPAVNNRALKEYEHTGLSLLARLVTTAAAHFVVAGDSIVEALQLLELGRGVTASLLLDTRSDITNLEKQYPQLAEAFTQVRDELNKRESDSPRSLHYSAAKRFDSMLEIIRGFPGFERFLLPPSKDEMIELANFGPIIIFNIATLRSDAFLLTKNGITCLPLPQLHYADVKKHAKWLLEALAKVGLSNYGQINTKLLKILEWLWDAAVKPILDSLEFTSSPDDDSKLPHIWWVTTGWLTVLPVHAAGRYTAAKTTENALDRVVSSYSPTLRGLVASREKARKQILQTTPECLLVCMPQTPNLEDLPGVADEVTRIFDVLPEAMPKHLLVTPATAEVEAHLRTCHIIHFACHGESRTSVPKWSELFFMDSNENPFSVEKIIQLQLEHCQFAYLSACHTAATRDSDSLDEAIHLAGACQLAGFPHVIATLWQVYDSDSSRIAQDVYSSMTGHRTETIDLTLAARGLNTTVRRRRDRKFREHGFMVDSWKNPLLWASYIHMGA